MPSLGVMQVAVVGVVYSASYDDVVTEVSHSPKLLAPPDIMKGRAAKEDVGSPLTSEPVEVGDVRMSDREDLRGAGPTLRHRLGGEYPGLLRDGHNSEIADMV